MNADFKKTEIDNDYSVESGLFALVNDRWQVRLNKYGQYKTQIDWKSISTKELSALKFISCMSNPTDNESTLAEELFSSHTDIQHDPLLGYYLGLYAGYVLEGDYRNNGSSGGFGTWILAQLLERNLIDGVVHVREVNHGDGILFKYQISRTIEEIKSGSKSRYYPVELSECIRTIRQTEGRYAVVGIPSFITELRLLAKLDPEIKKRVPFMIGLVCGHQKSTKYAEAIAWEHGITPGNLEKINFRKKIEGRSSGAYITEITGKKDGQTITLVRDQNQIFVSNWGHGMFKSKFSDYTDDVFNETSDLTLGDAWLPQYLSDSQGTNILIVRNPIIAIILKEELQKGSIKLDTLEATSIIASQSGLVHHCRDELPYRLQRKDRKNQWRPHKRFGEGASLPFLRKRVQNLRAKITALSHTAYLEAVERKDWNHFRQAIAPHLKRYRQLYLLIRIQNNGPFYYFKKLFSRLSSKFYRPSS